MVKRILAVLMAGMITLSVASCGTSNAGQGTKENDRIVLDMRAEPADVNSIKCSDAAGGDILRLSMSGLTRLDENDKPVGDLAQTIDVSEDGKTYTFHLVKNAKWSNGEPVTANDFVFAWREVLNKKSGAPYAFMIYTAIENGEDVYEGKKSPEELGVKAIDDYTLEVKLVNPVPYFLHLVSFYTFFPVNEKAYTQIGADNYAKDADKIVTNGPYNIAKWTHDDSVEFVKNENYHDAQRVKVPKVKLVMLTDENTRLNSWKANEVDVVNVSGTQKEALEKEGIKVNSFIDNGSWYLQFNTKKPGLNNPKIRKAIAQSIDIKSLCENIKKDGSVPSTGLTPTEIAGANGTKFAQSVGTLTKYDPEGAKKLLQEGLAEEGMTADQLKLDLLIDNTTGASKEAQFYQEQIQKNLGVKVEVRQMPFKARISAMNSGDFAMTVAGWSPDYNDAMTYLDMFTTTNGNNYGKYSNPKYDKLIADALKEVDPQKRQDLLVEAEKTIIDEAVVAPIYFSSQLYIESAKVKGLTRTGFQEFDFTDGTEIEVAK